MSKSGRGEGEFRLFSTWATEGAVSKEDLLWGNQAAENQATDRAHRIGQDKVVSVYRLIARHTIEERILQLQNKKMDLAEQVLEDNQVSMEKMTKQELLSLLEEEL